MAITKPIITHESRVANKRIRVYERIVDGCREVAYSITGGGWKVGTLFMRDISTTDAYVRALEEAQRRHPRSRVYVIK